MAYADKIIDYPKFYLGLIAPDAYHSRKVTPTGESAATGRQGAELSDRDITHLTVKNTDDWKNKALRIIKTNNAGSHKSFYAGYGIHILTDIYWDEIIYKPFLQRFANATAYHDASNPTPRQAYMSDMTKIDLWLYRTCKYKDEIWSYLSCGECFDVQDLVTSDEIDAERQLTLSWYDAKKTLDIDNFIYITPGQATDFIHEATAGIDDLLIIL